MASARTLLSLLSLTLLFLFPEIFAGDSNHPNLQIIASPFDFLKHIQGCKKGEKIKGIQPLKMYLEHFGYLSYARSRRNGYQANDDEFDDILESAVKTYQINYNLNATGILDVATVSQMVIPRCGMPDIINGTTRMRSANEIRDHIQGGSASFHTISRFKLFEGHPRWKRFHLTYAIHPSTRSDAIDPIIGALGVWASVSRFRFWMVKIFDEADIKISFEEGDHGNGKPFTFDGPAAHAFAPPDGRLHFNAHKRWWAGRRKNFIDIKSVALHEIGHLLGLDHSSLTNSVMYPTMIEGQLKGLGQDDIVGLHFLYHYVL